MSFGILTGALGPGGSSGGITVPGAPTLAVTPGNAQNVLSWTDGSTGGASITSHNIYRSTTAGSETLLGTIMTGSPYTDTGLTNGTTYYYTLTAVNSVGESVPSNEVSATPISPQLMHVATSTYFSQALAAAGTTSMTRKSHYARDAISAVRLGYSTAYADATTLNEKPFPAATPVKAWVEYPAGTYTAVTFASSASPTFAVDTVNLSDLITIPGGIPNGAQFWTWTYANAQIGTVPFVTGSANVLTTSAGEGSTIASSGVPTTPSSTVPTGTAACGMIPQVILGATTVKSVFIAGQSRGYGQYSSVSATSDRGYYAQLIAPTNPYANMCVPSESSDGFLGGSPTMRHRAYWSRYFTNVVDEMVYVDSRPVGGYRDHARAIFSGKGYMAVTYEGNTTSAGGWLSPDDQVNTSIGNTFIAMNQGIRASGLPYIDIADLIMTARDSGHFIVSPSPPYTSDGNHLNAAGNAFVVASTTGQGWVPTILNAPTTPFVWAPTLTASSPVFSTTGQKFGTGCLSGGGFSNWGIGPTGGAFTVELWAKQVTLGAATLVGGNGFSITISAAGVPGVVSGNITVTATGHNIADGNWHHLAVVSSPTATVIFVDGSPIANSVVARTAIQNQTAARTFGIRGAGSTALGTITNSATDPVLDEIVIWEGNKYTSAFTPPTVPYVGTEANLIVLMHLDDATVIVGPGA